MVVIHRGDSVAINSLDNPMWPQRHWIVAVDLGQSVDPTAIAVIERRTEPTDDWSSIRTDVATQTVYEVRHLERLPLGMAYPAQVDYVAALAARSPLGRYNRHGRLNTSIVIDRTGVGRPVFDMFRQQGVKTTGVTITAGEAEKADAGGYRVAKLQLVSRLQSLLHSGDLKIAAGLKDTAALVRELTDFRATFTSAGNPTFAAREGAHDDLVLAVAIGVWYGERMKGGRIGIRKLGL